MATNSNTYSVRAALIEARACLADAKSERAWLEARSKGHLESVYGVQYWEREVERLRLAAAAGIHRAKRG